MSAFSTTDCAPGQRVLRFIEEVSAGPDRAADGDLEAHFGELALDLFAWQFETNEPYRKLCIARKRSPDNTEHWTQIPAVPTGAFKEFDFSCLAADDRTTFFHTSGTSAQKSGRHAHNATSLELYRASLLPWFRRHFPVGSTRPHLLSLTPSSGLAPRSSLVHMLDVVRNEVCSLDSWFAGGVQDDGSWALEPDRVLSWLNRYAVLNQAVIVAGTAFNFVHLVDWMISRDVRVQLPPGSAVMETGGYKGRSRALPQAELHALISDRMGAPTELIVCEYGMCELSSQAYDQVAGTGMGLRLFRFPPWVRARVISSESAGEVPVGRAGLLQIVDLANAYSVIAIQTEDLVIRRDDGFEYVGRAEAAEPRGCSLMAL